MQVTLFVCLHTCTLAQSCVSLLSWVLLSSDVIRQLCVAIRPGVTPVNAMVDWALKNSYLSIRVYIDRKAYCSLRKLQSRVPDF